MGELQSLPVTDFMQSQKDWTIAYLSLPVIVVGFTALSSG